MKHKHAGRITSVQNIQSDHLLEASPIYLFLHKIFPMGLWLQLFNKISRTVNILLLLSLFTLLQQTAGAQSDSLEIGVRGVAVYSSDHLVPLWLHSNQYGQIDAFGNGQLLGHVHASYEHRWNEKLSLTAGTGFWTDNELDRVTPGQLFAAVSFQSFTLIAGKKNLDYLPGQEADPAFFNFRNIRPMPAISFGFFDYTPVPFTREYLQFKAALLQGRLNDERESPGVRQPYYHFKSLYLKTGNLPVNIFAGMNHSVLFGGTLSDGTEIPVDWISTYLINSSETLKEFNHGEGTNAPGEHVGLSEFGIHYETDRINLFISKQDPMTDYSGLFRSKDKILNFRIQIKKTNWLEEFSYQYAYTKHQTGPGLHLAPFREVEDYSLFLKENFGLDADVNTWEEFYPYLKEYVNRGYPEYGRDNYFNHGIYRLGHFYDEHFYGYPLMHSKEQIKYFKDIDDFNYSTIGNNRLQAHHFAMKGSITKGLTYNAKVTFSENFGTYNGFYTKWLNEREGYYFREGKKQNYYLLELSQQLPRNFTAQAAFGFDGGSLYQSWGIRCGISWVIFPLN